ncbi:hypothetical protein V0U79_12125 [Hyphobacterium sp. HN65]|uniref:DUF5681 domain-containing protein n=1 Tax=Hyphobacterium lacteum TaxID=3116575 RepID=A0ABU7LT77_9PROT|nr:hypothetical protein [Hyphobacterium sp. HN65]MEE2527117.1 hypothetical protein [Hyphobacterium sp. HN65]
MPKGAKYGGRKKGTPNRTTAATRERIASEADPIGFMIQIMKGEPVDGERPSLDQRAHAARWLGAKLIPDAKEAPIDFHMAELSSPTDALNALSRLAQALGGGLILPSDARAITHSITGYLKAYETTDIEARLSALEQPSIS